MLRPSLTKANYLLTKHISLAMSRILSEEAKLSIRRKRKAKRLFRDVPLFAFNLLNDEIGNYSYDQFSIDITYRKPRKKRKSRSPLVRYGRFKEIQKHLGNWYATKDPSYLLIAQQLRNRITQPYRMQIRVGQEFYEFTFDPTYSIDLIREINQIKFNSLEEFNAKKDSILKFSNIK